MNFNNLPLKKEVMGWNPQSSADYMRKSNLKNHKSYPQGGPKKAFGHRPRTQRFPQQALGQEEEVWDSDEFDNESNGEDEAPHQDGREDSYICAVTESHDIEEEYEKLSVDPVKPPQHPRAAEHCNASQPSQLVDRSKKLEQSGSSKNDVKKSKGSTIKSFRSSFRMVSKPKPPKPSEVYSRTSKAPPPPQVSLQAANMNSPLPVPRKAIPNLDPRWYRGQMTRHQAEDALREVNEDGAFLVRDSSKRSEEHPYTLMLLKQNKVFNIKIRNQGNSYSLGNGFNKSFPGVREMITHHTHTPLLLIDATDQSSEAQNHCCLLHPAGL